jgi:isopenicillin N synthase-like dioxygenase
MSVPVFDWQDASRDPDGFARALGACCRETGFFLLRGHGVATGLIADAFAQADAFFAQAEAAKAPLSINTNPHNRGWAYMGSEGLDAASGQKDRKEAFNIGFDLPPDDPRVLRGEAFRGVNLWPDLPGFRATMLEYYAQAHALGVALLGMIARDLSLPPDHFAPHFTEPMAILRLLSYPAASGAQGEIGAGAHTDYGALTLLLTDGAPGLQVRPRGGDWQDVPHVDGAFVVNIGDCLMRWSNDRYVSTPHRVLPPPRARKSVAFFLDPNPDSLIACLPGTGAAKYPPVTGAEYLASRLAATYG